jgi:hypothetical protein
MHPFLGTVLIAIVFLAAQARAQGPPPAAEGQPGACFSAELPAFVA